MIRYLMATTALAIALSAPLVQAQSNSGASASPAKKELVAKIVKLQQPGFEGFARTIVQQNTNQVLQAAGNAVQQRVAADRREAVWRDIQADGRKFAEEAFAIVRDRALKLGPAIISPMLEERFNEDELKQLIALMESPVGKKFASMNGEIMKALADKLMAEVRPTVDPKMQAFQQSVASRLTPAPPATASGPGK